MPADNNNFHHAVLNSLSAHIAVLDRQGAIVAVNDAWSRFARDNGAPAALITGVGVNYLDVCRQATGPASEGAQACLTGLLAVLAGSLAEFELEYPCHSPAVERWFFLRAAPLTSGAGGVVISHIDITESKKVEKALNDSREQFQLLLNSTAEAVCGLDLEGRCTFCNLAALRLLGYEHADALLGKSLHDMVHHTHPDGAPYSLSGCHLYQALQQGENAHSDTETVWRADGTCFPAECWCYPMYRSGAIIGAVVTFVDITERQRAAQDVQRIRAYLHNIIDSMPSILVGVDTQGGVTEWNRSAERATSVPAVRARGRPVSDLLPQYPWLPAMVSEAIQQRQPVTRERQVTEENNRLLSYWDAVVYPLSVADQVEGAVIRIDEVTSRVLLEQRLLQSDKMLSLGGLAAGMAHELNNPLGIVLQSGQNLRRRLSPDLPANRQAAQELGLDFEQLQHYLERRRIFDFVDNIEEAAQRAAHIVTDMLAFRRPRTTRFTPAPLADMLDNALRRAEEDRNLKQQYDLRQVEIIRDYDPDLDMVACDRSAIEQVLLNLIKNAAQAMAEADSSPPRRLTLRTRKEADWACIRVADNGPGIAAPVRNHLFDPFFTTKPVGSGTGLGLFVSYFIITEQHGGTISVDSSPAEGTCFIIRLPLQRAPVASS